MKLTRLDFVQHPRPPQRELRQRGVFDSEGSLLGHVADLYTDNDRTIRFVDVAMRGFMGSGKEHHPVPIEAVAEEGPGSSITLRVARRTVERTPTLGDPNAAPDGTMYGRVTTMRVLEGEFDRVLRFVEEPLLLATEMQRGFCGEFMFSDRSANRIVTVSWWDSQAKLEATGRCEHLPEQIRTLLLYLAELPQTEDYQLDATS